MKVLDFGHLNFGVVCNLALVIWNFPSGVDFLSLLVVLSG